jgi:OFA family oxalate/formate antiporter-like MFS transporter
VGSLDHPPVPRISNRWFQLSASLVAMIMIANLQYAWTLFVQPLRHATGWKLSDIQWGFTLFILCQTWVQPFEGWLIDRLGQRVFITLAGVLCGFGWAGLGSATTLRELYALYAMAGIGASLVYGASMGSALKWFRDRRGLASGIMAAGFASGASLFIPLIARTIDVDGYRAAFLRTGILQGVAIVIVAQFLRMPVREAATLPVASAKSRIGAHQFTTAEMLGTGHFYLLYAMFLLMGIGGLLVTAQVGPIATTWGFAPTTLVLAATLSPLANGGGRIFWGQVSDRIGREKTMFFAFTIQAMCLSLVITIGRRSSLWFIITLLATYFTWGEIYALFPAALADYFGTRHATSNNCVLYTSKGVASIVAGGLAAKLFESHGTWTPAFVGSAAMALTSAALALGLWRVTAARPSARAAAPASTAVAAAVASGRVPPTSGAV